MKRPIMIVFLTVLLVSGCIGIQNPPNKIEYYTLEYTPLKPVNSSPLPLVIRIERFNVAPLYNSHKIIYSDKPFKRNEYGYHKWRANPGDLVSYFIARDLKISSLFQGVFAVERKMPHSHTLTGVVDEFYEFDGKKSWEAVLTFNITLTAKKEEDVSKNIIFQKIYHTRALCRQKNPQGLAEAMSQAMQKLSSELIMDIYKVLKEESEDPS